MLDMSSYKVIGTVRGDKRLDALGEPVMVLSPTHVYVVLEFNKNKETRVLGVYQSDAYAWNHVRNLCRKFGHLNEHYGIIKKRLRP